MEMTLTKNFWADIHTLLFCMPTNTAPGTVVTSNNGFSNASYVTVLGGFKDTSGNTQTNVSGDSGTYMFANHLQLFTFNQTGNGTKFAVGSGTTAATVEDYAVEAEIANASVSVTGQNSLNGSCTFHVTVTATADISVGEICMMKKLKTAGQYGTDYTVLIGRAVLGTPVALANGESKTFDVTISLPMPA